MGTPKPTGTEVERWSKLLGRECAAVPAYSTLEEYIRALQAERDAAVGEVMHYQREATEANNRAAEAVGLHCKDCCCARSWDALEITENTGKSIPEHIEELRARALPEGHTAVDGKLLSRAYGLLVSIDREQGVSHDEVVDVVCLMGAAMKGAEE